MNNYQFSKNVENADEAFQTLQKMASDGYEISNINFNKVTGRVWCDCSEELAQTLELDF